jgi:hypothetical protein
VGEPVAVCQVNPSVAYVGDTVTFDGTGSSDGGAGPLTYEWDVDSDGSVDATGSTAPWVTGAAGTYNVTLNVTNAIAASDQDFCTWEVREKLGLICDLYTSENRFCGQTTPNIGEGKDVPADALSPDVNVTFFYEVSWNGKPVMHVLVGFEVLLEWREIQQYPERIYEPVNECIAYRTAETDKDGIAKIHLRIPNPCNPEDSVFGKWLVIAGGKVQEVKCEDTLRFDVGYVINLHEVWPLKEVDQIWQRVDEFDAPCDWMGFEIELKNIMWIEKELTLVVVIYDDCDVPIGQVIVRKYVQGGAFCDPHYETVQILNAIHLPQWTYVGVGKVYVSAYTGLPSECGVPYSPEISKTFIINWSGLV